MTHRLSRRAALAAALLVPNWGARAQADGGRDETRIDVEGESVPVIIAKPDGTGPFPLVLVAENGTGLDRVVTEACSLLAKEGFFAVAPLLFAPDVPDAKVMQRLDAAVAWATQQGADRGRLGIVGFGPGGRAAWLYDAHNPALKAAVAWYSPMQGTVSAIRPVTALDAASRLHAPLLGLHGKNDGTPQRVLLDAEARAKQANKTAEIVLYVGAGQDFAVAGSPRFDQAATLDGWQRTLSWLRAHLPPQPAKG